ncbi:hypothetical protein D3C76_415270 [compost metagenome]
MPVGDQPQFPLAGQALVGDDLVASIVASAVLFQIAVRCLQRPMRRGIGREGEEGFTVRRPAIDHFDHAIGVPGAGIEVLRQLDRLAIMQVGGAVVGQQRHVGLLEVCGTTFEQYVGLLETAILRL